jgi:hypothetical protein
VGRARTLGLAGVALTAAFGALSAFSVAPAGRELRGPPEIVECAGADAIDFGCYQRRYRAMVASQGARIAIRDLSEQSARVGYVRAACHQLMHGIGRDAGRRDGIRAFGDGAESCSSGFYHGVVEAVMSRIGAPRIAREAARVCAAFRERGRHGAAHYNCVHGMGHGFMELHAGDVFRSLKACGVLPDRWEQRHCEGGVFMENLTASANPERPSRHLRPDQPLYPCTAVARRYKHDCYMKQTAYALYLRDDDFGAVFALCGASPDVAFRPDCFQGVGGDASIRASKYITGARATRAAVRRLCRLGPDRAARRNCVIGAVTVIVRDGASQTANPVAFCSAFREAELRAACAQAHLKTARALATEADERQNRVAFRGHGPRLLCQAADRLETTSARTSAQQDDRRDVR